MIPVVHPILFLLFLICFMSVLVSVVPYQAFADGFTQESLPPASVGNKKISLFIKINPPILTSANNQDRYLLFRWFDANTNQTIQHTTFLVAVTKQNQLLMQAIFHSHTGILKLKIIPSSDPKKWSINSTSQPFIDSTMYVQNDEGPIDVTAPILGEGGLYHIYMSLITIDNDQNIFLPENAPTFDSYLSVGDVTNHIITYKNNSYNTTLISYYDKTTSYEFDPGKMQISWSMPFDWNASRYQNTPVFVHEEVRIPKSFKGLADESSFIGTLNGIPITSREVIVDPYSFNDTTIIHVVLTKNDIENLGKLVSLGEKTMNFEISPTVSNVTTSSNIFTDFGGWEVKLQWNPNFITSNTKNNLKLNFFDAQRERMFLGYVTYDLKILDNEGSTLMSKTSLIAKNGTDFQSIILPSNGFYSIEVNIKSILSSGSPDTSRAGLARGNLVIPSTIVDQATIPEFPFSFLILSIAVFLILLVSNVKSRFPKS